jgi:hypothetical protein
MSEQAAPKKRRKPGGGNKPKLTEDQEAELQQELRQKIAEDPAIKHDSALAWLQGSAVPKIKTRGRAKLTVSPSTLYRRVLVPVLGKRKQ